jgi:hypothetical protein
MGTEKEMTEEEEFFENIKRDHPEWDIYRKAEELMEGRPWCITIKSEDLSAIAEPKRSPNSVLGFAARWFKKSSD